MTNIGDVCRAFVFITATIIALAVGATCSEPPRAKVTIGVNAQDFERATDSAMALMNRWAGCAFLVRGGAVQVMSASGEPCGDPWRPEAEEGHSATAYQCHSEAWEIHVSKPGDLHTQFCIVAHELGHVAGLQDGGRGIMNQYECPEFVKLTDAEASFLKGKFCH